MKVRMRQFLRERRAFSETGSEELLSVSEYYGVKPRAVAFSGDDGLSRAESLEGYRIVHRGDLVMNYMLAWKGAYGVSEHEGLVSPAYAVFEVDTSVIDGQFLHHWFRSNRMRSEFRRWSKGIIESRLRLYPDALLRLDAEIPDLDTQKAIADVLDKETARIDQLIEKKQRLVELLGERVASDAFYASGGLPKGLWGCEHPSAAMAEVPEGWSVRKLSSFCNFVQGKAHEPYFDPNGEFICATARFVSSGVPNRYCTLNLTPAKPGDILMVMSDLPNGRALARSYLVRPGDKIAVNQRVCAITPREGEPRYFAYQLNRNRQLLRYNDGTNQTHLSNRAFKSMMLVVPPLDAQRRIADELDNRVDATTNALRLTDSSIDRLKEYRSALITAAVTGQIDATRWGKTGEGDKRLDQIQEEMAG